MNRHVLVIAWVTLHGALSLAAEPGLVAFYAFDEGGGAVVKDLSDQTNDGKLIGGVRWVKGTWGTAIELDGKDGYVDGGAGKSLNIADGGTLMLWCYPRTLQGGLLNWSTSGSWNDERLVMAVNTYHGGRHALGVMADGGGCSQFSLGTLQANRWNHVALAFDGRTTWVYNDGVLVGRRAQSLKPNIAGVPMWVGKCLGLGQSFFNGMIDEVRVYNRPLSAKEIADHYRQEGARRGKDLNVFNRLVVSAAPYPSAGTVLTRVDARAMRLAHDIGSILVTATPVRKTAAIGEWSETGAREVSLDFKDLAPGQYRIRAAAFDTQKRPVGQTSEATVDWPGVPAAFKNIRVLNNLCWELFEAEKAQGLVEPRTFTVPIDRWLFVRTVAEVAAGAEARVIIDGDPTGRPATVHSVTGAREAMRYLKAGRYKLRVDAQGAAVVKRITVRAIPALQQAFYGSVPHIQAYGPHDWEMMSKDVLPNVNVMISGAVPKPEHIQPWKESGRSWIAIQGYGVADVVFDSPDAADKVFAAWSASQGYQHPLMDGIIVDEFGGGDGIEYDVYRRVVERLNATYRPKIYMPYGGRFYGDDRSTTFAQAALAGGGYVCPEYYLAEQPSRRQAEQFIDDSLVSDMLRWERGMPGVIPRVIAVLGYMSQPTESLNIDPSVNFKVYMDLQMRALATHPSCFGLGGFQWYHSSYCDEENVRWAGRLYRHYAIEGNTSPLTDDPYVLTHLRNPDFSAGTEGWTIEPAESGSVRTGAHAGYSWLEGRYPRTNLGDTFLIMKRSDKKPNVVSQEIKDLTPGRMYSLKMITADHQNLIRQQSDKKANAVSIRLDNVELSDDPKRNFQFTFPNCYAHLLGKFDAQYNYWMNYHWRVFKAKGTTARLTITDWQNDRDPGGPVGQELMFNFVEIQPYLGD
ncbi:MAG: LamG domain-containing protein [Rhodopirellula sp.]|nr:LamG domain-containing protein [Rhodopirellula sp.]